MLKSQRSFRFTAVRFAVIAVIAASFLTLAVGTSAAGLSFFDSVKEFFGLQSASSGSTAPAAAKDQPHAAFTPGNLVVIQVGDGVAAVTGASAQVALLEYTTAGSLVQTIGVNSTGSSPRLTVTGSSGSEAHLVRSSDGNYLTFTGYDVIAGTAATTFAVPGTNRVIGRVDSSGTVDLTTAFNDGSTGAVRSAASTNGTDMWMTNAGVGLRYGTFGTVAASTQVTASPTNTRVVKVFNGQLYMSSGSGGFACINSVGTGTPTGSGNTTTPFAGMTCTSRSPYSFSINPAGDTMYVADDGAFGSNGGIQKWTLSAGTWSNPYTLLNTGAATTSVRGLIVDWSGANPVIFATTASVSANLLISVTDTGSGSTATTLATAPTFQYFRGVDFAPQAPAGTPTNTATATNTATNTPTGGPTDTATDTPTATNTATNTATPTPTNTPPPVPSLVISQIYGGGGNTGATYTNDYIEIFNRSASPVNIGGWSVQYAAATGTTWQVTSLSSATIPSGGYYLIQQASGGAVGAPLPLPVDDTGTINMAATAGKVALTYGTTALTGGCPFPDPTLVDFIGYGTTADCFEGPTAAPAPSNILADFRGANGCTDTNNNGADFSAATPAARNSASPINLCNGTPTNTATASPTPTNTSTSTPTATLTGTATNTPTPTPTAIPGPFTAGNLVIDQVGTGVLPTTNASTAVDLYEYTTAGVWTGRAVAIPPASVRNAADGLTDSGSATSNGHLNLSMDGTYLSVIGVAEPVGTSGVITIAAINRNVARINNAGTVEIRASLTDAFAANNPRAAASTDGNTYWLSGNPGVRYLADTSSMPTTSTEIVAAGSTRAMVLAKDASNNVFLLQTTQTAASFFSGALPTTATAPTSIGATLVDAGALVALDRSPTVGATGLGGLDTIYVADGSTTTSSATAILRKFEWDTGTTTWIAMGTATMADAGSKLFGLTERVQSGNVELYATTFLSTGGANELVSIVDSSGFGGTLSGTLSVLATAPANQSFRGVAFAPSSAGGTGSISGTITYGNAIGNPVPPRFVKNVTVQSTAGAPPVGPVITGLPGTYTLTGFVPGPYTIKPSKPGGPNGAISSFDAGRTAQGVSGAVAFVSQNQRFTADASGGGGNVSSLDAAKIAQFAAGLPTVPPNNTGLWKFFVTGAPSPLPTPPQTYNDNRSYATVTSVLTGEDYIGLLVGDVTGNWNPAIHARPAMGPERTAAVTAPRLVTPADNEVIIPVSVQGVANKDVIAYEFDLRYDPMVIQPQAEPVDVAGTVSRALSVVTNPYEPGLLRVVVYGAYPIDENGLLLNLRFAAVGAPGSVSPLTFERIMFNEGDPGTLATDGEVELSMAAPNQAEITGRLLNSMGQGVPNARVKLTDTTGESRSVVSNGFGVYRFGGLQVGQTYTLSVESRGLSFTPLTVSVTSQSVNVDMIARQ